MTGILADQQVIYVYDSEDDADSANSAPVVSLSSEERPLGYYSLRDGQVLKVCLWITMSYIWRVPDNASRTWKNCGIFDTRIVYIMNAPCKTGRDALFCPLLTKNFTNSLCV